MALQQKTLSNRTVMALRVTRDTVFWDRDLTGFGVRVYPSGGKVYVAQARGLEGPDKPNKPKRVTVGRHDVISAEQARRRAALIICAHQGGRIARAPAAGRQSGWRPDRCRSGRALSRRACRCAREAQNGREGPHRASPRDPARSRPGAARGGGARSGCRPSTENVRYPVGGQYGGEDAVAHVPADRRY